jgi:hypothetical protein
MIRNKDKKMDITLPKTVKPLSLSIIILIFTHCQFHENRQKSDAIINIWYGHTQQFGLNGNPQRQINILGNINSHINNLTVYYLLNKNSKKNILNLGCDLHRLANKGDFNIEIDRSELNPEKNLVQIFVEKDNVLLEKEEIILQYSGNKNCLLPYEVKWNEVNNIQHVVEIVDGHWELVDGGIRTLDKYYDRIITFGDSLWKNYEVRTSVIFHGYTPPSIGPPTYNVTHAAIASRWPGHDFDSLQPNRKWYPLGATSEFRITDNYDSCRWRIFDGENFYSEQCDSFFINISPDKKYFIKHRVEDISETETLYSVKLWESTLDEPEKWNFQAKEPFKNNESGSVCLIAHHTDVTFGDIRVIPIPGNDKK